MNRLPASGSVIVTGPASRSNTAAEYSVSRFRRMTVWLSIGCRFAVVEELAEAAVLDDVGEVQVASRRG